MASRFETKQLLQEDPDKVQTYWQTLYMHDLLKDRFPDIEDPSWSNVLDVIRKQGASMFVVVDHDAEDIVVAEFHIYNAVGRVAMLHFSIHPEMPLQDKVRIVEDTSAYLLQLDAISGLLGLTPLDHAKLLLKKAGWECRGILNDCVRTTEGFLDAHIMIKQ